MKKITPILLAVLIFSCNTDNTSESHSNISLNFSHSWNGTPITNADFNAIKFINAKAQNLSITELRYIVSKIVFTKATGEDFVFEGYNLVDVTNNTNLKVSVFEALPNGSYTNISFVFGLNNEDNYKNHKDLNIASWSVPEVLGGGYHYMQLEGKFIDNTNTAKGYAYHTIRAVDISKETPVFQDTFFTVNLGEVTITNNSSFTIEMNVAEWFNSPNIWDLNSLNNTLMPNFNAQILMFNNGKNVFSLKE